MVLIKEIFEIIYNRKVCVFINLARIYWRVLLKSEVISVKLWEFVMQRNA